MIVAPATNHNSFISLAAADTYHADRGNADWEAAGDDAKETALVRAADFIKLTYTFSVDPLEGGKVNDALVCANALLGLYALSTDLLSIRAERDVVESESELEGVGMERMRFGQRNSDRFPMVTAMLSAIAAPRSSSVVVGRLIR